MAREREVPNAPKQRTKRAQTSMAVGRISSAFHARHFPAHLRKVRIRNSKVLERSGVV
jgi:hypothetical protein